ncbi:MAG: MarR family winged helix-turn-helix transcriptional regulator [Acidimicrobiales bacterium]|jgi:DNA-binding MarR family transcriptional regulator
MPPESSANTALQAERPGHRDEPYEVVAHADELLTVMASIRRSGRLLARQPVELSTLTGSQLDLVRLVLRRPGVSVTQAAEELRLAPNTVSTLVRQLTDEHLLTRRVDQQDRRVARLDLAPAMRRKVGAFHDRRVAMLVSAIALMSASDRRRLADSVAVLEQLAGRLQEQESAGV